MFGHLRFAPVDELVSEYVTAVPHPAVRQYVHEYTGYRLEGYAPGVHMGLPSGTLTFIVAFDNPLRLSLEADADGPTQSHWSMLAGLHDRPAQVWHRGDQHGMQLAVTPQGASALFGESAAVLASEVVALEDIDLPFTSTLLDRLDGASGWPARFAILDDLLLEKVGEPARVRPEVEYAWQALVGSAGAVSIGALALDVGWSRRHLGECFRQTFGLPPKVMGRVLRFDRAQQLVRGPDAPPLSVVAAICGYADQAHMTREWRQFAGRAPSAWLAAEQLPFVQDGAVDVMAQ